MLTDNPIPEPLQTLLADYLRLVDEALPDLVTAFYLHGSIALGAFNEEFSDIDFISVISRRATAADLEQLRVIHKTISQDYPRWQFNGSYFQAGDMGQSAADIVPHPYHHDGRLYDSGHYEVNRVMWWLLKTNGITLRGPQAQTLDYSVDWDALLADMAQNLNSYWANFTRQPARMAWLLSDWGIQWAVLGVLRQFYTFRERDIISKTGAGEYALKHLPERWYPIISEAINLREQRGGHFYRSRIGRAVDAFRFLRYVIWVSSAEYRVLSSE